VNLVGAMPRANHPVRGHGKADIDPLSYHYGEHFDVDRTDAKEWWR